MPKPKVPANVFGKFVEKLGGGSVDGVTPKQLVAAAKSSPIARLFDWNNKTAAEKFRLAQARNYLNGIQIVRVNLRDGSSQSTRAFHVASSDGRRAYISHDQIVGEPELRAQVIGNAKARLESYIASYANLAAMNGYIPRLQQMVDEMREDISSIEAAATKRRRATNRGNAKVEGEQRIAA